MDCFVPRNDRHPHNATTNIPKTPSVIRHPSLRAKRGNPWLASYLAMTDIPETPSVVRHSSFVIRRPSLRAQRSASLRAQPHPSLRAQRGNPWIASYLAMTNIPETQ
jgi:hypothetical protein